MLVTAVGSSIVNLSSAAGSLGFPLRTRYAAVQAGAIEAGIRQSHVKRIAVLLPMTPAISRARLSVCWEPRHKM